MKNIKIGITTGIRTNDEALWTNGMKLNCLILARMLNKSKNNYQVCLLNFGQLNFEEKLPDYLSDVDVFKFEEKYEEMDLIIVMGAQINEEYMIHFKSIKPSNRIISYRCGNNYIISTENIIFKESETVIHQYEKTFDELWYIPQQHETNYGYYSTLYRTDALLVPFVWNQNYLVKSLVDVEKTYQAGTFKKGIKYDPTKEKKVIGVMEPNINIVKFCLIPMLIAEESYRSETGKNKIEKLMLTNAEKVSKHKDFLGIVENLDLYKDNKISAESRYQTSYFVTQYLDIVLCHQLLNPLNYLYLDVAYMGYPVLHNAPMCKDLGYYYEGSDTKAGAKMLNWILENHDNNIEEYKERNKEALWRYFSDNPELIKTYDILIYNLFNGGNSTDLEYVPETNLYTNLKKNKKTKKTK